MSISLFDFFRRLSQGSESQRRLEVATLEDVTQVQTLAARLKSWLDEVRYEQAYMKKRVERHLKTQSSTHARTLFFSIGEASAILAMGGLQVVFFKRLFSTTSMRRQASGGGPPAPGILGNYSTFASQAAQPISTPWSPGHGGPAYGGVARGGRLIV